VTTMKPKDVLIATKALLHSPAQWTQEAFARNKNGEVISANSPDATCWCLLGAMDKVLRDNNARPAVAEAERIVRNVIRERTGNYWIDGFNDSEFTTHADVLALLDKAIERAGQ
jgi:hypothetical protein